MGGVKNQCQPVAIRNGAEGIDLAWLAPQVHTKNAARPGGNQALYMAWIDVMSRRIDVAEYGSDSQPSQCLYGGDVSERGDDNFAATASERNVICNASVPLHVATQWRTPATFAMRSSNSLTSLPSEYHRLASMPSINSTRRSRLIAFGPIDMERLIEASFATKYH